MAFKRPSIFWILLISFGILTNFCYAFLWKPPLFFNPLFFIFSDNSLVTFAKITIYLAILIHVGEAFYAFNLSSATDKENRWRWAVQTLLFGYSSIQVQHKELGKAK